MNQDKLLTFVMQFFKLILWMERNRLHQRIDGQQVSAEMFDLIVRKRVNVGICSSQLHQPHDSHMRPAACHALCPDTSPLWLPHSLIHCVLISQCLLLLLAVVS